MRSLLMIILKIKEQKDIEAYLQEYGPISDKTLAIQAIIDNPYAFELLDSTLKTDPDVLIYWYPSTVEKISFFNGGRMIDEIGVSDEQACDESYWSTTCEIFPQNSVLNLILDGNRSDDNFSLLVFGLTDSNFSRRYQAIFSYLLDNSKKDMDSSMSPTRRDITTYTINRSLISQAVDEFGFGEKGR